MMNNPVILRERERSEPRPKDRYRAKAVELPRGKAIPRRFAPQDDARGPTQDDVRGVVPI